MSRDANCRWDGSNGVWGMDKLRQIQKLVRLGLVRITQHAHQEMVADDFL